MSIRSLAVRGTLAFSGFALGWVAGCSSGVSGVDLGGETPGAPSNGGSTGGAAGDSGAGGANECPACVTDSDCASGSICAQFGGDTYCAPLCAADGACASDRSCATVSSANGNQSDVCVPRGDVCGADVGPGGGGPTVPDGGDPGVTGVDSGTSTCGSLLGPSVPAKCNSCGSNTCQPNGCYGGWWCNTGTNKCQSPPTSCPKPVDAGGGGGGVPDAGGPVSGSVGPGGGTVSRLLFSVVGDTRPANIDDNAGYPTAVITKIFSDIAASSPMPSFVVSTGDYQFSTATGSNAATQMDMYLGARAKYPGVQFPAMGNHECTGATASNCGSGNTNGVTNNYTAFMQKMLAPINQTNPYYRIDINAADGSWTSKFLFVAGNAWDSAQSTWLDQEMAKPTTYTFVVRHESASANTAPGVTPSEAIMKKYPYTLSIVGHTHTYSHSSGSREVIIGNGGAPLTSGGNFGYGLLSQRSDGAIVVDMIDYSTGAADAHFHFAVKADGSATP